MPRPNEVEEILARLMPLAMSEGAELAIEEEIGELAEEAGLATEVTSKRYWPWGIGAAAALVLSILPFFLNGPGEETLPSGLAELSDQPTPMVELAHSDRLESIEQQGWHEDQHGSTHQAVRLKMVAQQEILDPETGIRMTVSEPREELLLVPVCAF